MTGLLRSAATFVLAIVLVFAGIPGISSAESARRQTFTNPISSPAADTFADPAVLRGEDGFWYAYGTADPLHEGERFHHGIPILRSADLVRWVYVADVFTPANRPGWAAPGAGLWAPEIRYADGRYLLYFTVTDTTANPGSDPAIGVATAPTPAGPWTDSGGPVVAPRPAAGGGYQWTYDPAMLTDAEGRRWLYFGSYVGGLFVVPLSSDGLRVTGDAIQVAIADRYEASYVVRHEGWYFLFASAANCCAGPATGYSVFAGRSANPAGPFVDRAGRSLLDSRVGGTPVLQPNGNRWAGTGHNAVVSDAAGQDWLLYHAIPRDKPYLDEPYGINRRPMLLDRLDWIDGWPMVRGGAGASDGEQPAPVTTGVVDDRFERSRLGPGWRGPAPDWTVVPHADPDSGGLLRHTGEGPGRLPSTKRIPADAQIGLDLRVTGGGAAGVALRVRSQGDQVSVTLDESAAALITDVTVHDGHSMLRTPLPPGFRYGTWHTLTVRIVGQVLRVAVTEGRPGNPVAEQERDLPWWPDDGGLTVLASGPAEVDNVSAAPASRPARQVAPEPRAGWFDPSFSDDFAGSLGPQWTWVRPDPSATVESGALRWPTQAAELVGTGNDASVLLRDAPNGDYVVETEFDLDVGVGIVRNFEQAGLIAYVSDDDFARLSHVAIWNTRQIEYGRELPYAGRTVFGGMALTAPATTTWLRLAHSVDYRTGEHRFRAGASLDGYHWEWGGTWTFPASTTPRIGLIAHGGDTPPATAVFHYFRVYRG
ncbi:family 43 glycosylhydrolase [Amycolatopsis sp. NPDC058986]|uniref:family 43 glycosylhydrolase n=1 Tax=unclassified Amycolatopsis TaxID=2618356 RepID=UPI00366ADFC7